MTLRPFKITYKTSNDDKVRYYILDHRGNYLLKNGKLGKKFFGKLLSYPITAFGYDIFQMRAVVSKRSMGDIELNPKFDKKDVIKALDFWIEYFVYQNKCDYILENTVNKDFELHLEELIRVREAVLKDPTDTKYVRQKIRPPISKEELRGGGHDFDIEIPVNGIRKFYKYDAVDNREITNMTEEEIEKYSKMYMPFTRKKPLFQPASSDQIIEFTENVLETSNTPFSTVDQFCYKVKTMTRKEYKEQKKNKPYATGQINYNLQRNFRDNELRLLFEGPAVTTAGWFQVAVDRSISELSRALSEVGAGTTAAISPGGDWNPVLGTEPSSSSLAGKRISRVDVRLRSKEGEPTGSID